jgi:SAM-dependent methyltransferase
VNKNHFLADEAAARYDRSRPYFHPLVFARLTELVPAETLERSLDIACGTGQSTQALSGISRSVFGLDASAAMLAQARRRGVRCVQSSAEQLPLLGGQFDLVAICLAFHWFDKPTALREIRRVLKRHGWVLIFAWYFNGRMRENPRFPEWFRLFERTMPKPPLDATPLSPSILAETGFRQVTAERFVYADRYTIDQLIAFLITLSNVTAVLEDGRQTCESVEAWLRQTLEPFFVGPTGTFEFDGNLTLLETVA